MSDQFTKVDCQATPHDRSLRPLRSWLWGLLIAPFLVSCSGSSVGQDQSEPIPVVSSESLGNLSAPELQEISGLAAAAPNQPGYWVHNDSGDLPHLYLLDPSGKLLNTYRLSGAQHRDWEDLCVAERQGERWLVIADVGDNESRRETCDLYLIREPVRDATRTAKTPIDVAAVQRRAIRYADGPRDCEAIAYDPPADALYLLEKKPARNLRKNPAGVYRLAGRDLWESAEPLVAERVGELAIGNITAADFSPSGQRCIIRNYSQAWVGQRSADESWETAWNRHDLRQLPVPRERQGEAIAFDRHESTVVLTSEGTGQPLWRVTWEPATPATDPPAAAIPFTNQEPVQPLATAAPIKTLVVPGETWRCGEHAAFIMWPPETLRQTPQPWVFYAPTLPPYPDRHEVWLLEQLLAAGVAVAGVDVGEAYGSPASREVFEAFFQEVTHTRGLAARPVLLGRSRGGLWCGNWAADHPERFTGLAGIYPVFDWRTYPGVEATARAYGVSTDELLARQTEWNPVARGDILAKAQLPVFMIHGDQDDVVPLAENSAALADCYRRLGAAENLVLEVVPGQGHNYWEGFFRSPAMVDFLIHHARRGADNSGR